MPSTIAIIPARFASTRFPGKALADHTGKPLIQHVYEQAIRAACLDRVLIATDDQGIADAARTFGADVVMTRADHPNGTSRLAEVAEQLDAEIIVNVQGDEPELDPALIDLAVELLRKQPDCPMSTIAAPFSDDEDASDPNIVKVVLDQRSRALYFSRALIPHLRDACDAPARPLRHIGLYAYRRAFLLRYVTLPPTPLELTEQLEQLRVLEHGESIAIAIAQPQQCTAGIDTPEQYEAFVQRYRASAQKLTTESP